MKNLTIKILFALFLVGCITTRDPVQVKEIKVTCIGQVENWRGGIVVGYLTLWEDQEGNKYQSSGRYHFKGEERTVFIWR
jgi:hypothetical protein